MIAVDFVVQNYEEALGNYRYLLQRTHSNHTHLREITARFRGPCQSVWQLLGLCEAQRRLAPRRNGPLALHITGGTNHGANLQPEEREAYETALCAATGGIGFFVWHLGADEEDRDDFHLLVPACDGSGRVLCKPRAAFRELLRRTCAEVTARLNVARLERGDFTLGSLDENWQVFYAEALPAPVQEPAPEPPAAPLAITDAVPAFTVATPTPTTAHRDLPAAPVVAKTPPVTAAPPRAEPPLHAGNGDTEKKKREKKRAEEEARRRAAAAAERYWQKLLAELHRSVQQGLPWSDRLHDGIRRVQQLPATALKANAQEFLDAVRLAEGLKTARPHAPDLER